MPKPLLCCLTLLLFVTGCAAERGNDPLTRLPVHPNAAGQIGYVNNWFRQLELGEGQQISSVTRLDDLLVVVEAPRNILHALEISDGSERWRRVIGDRTDILFGPARQGDRIYINSQTRMYTLNVNSGRVERYTDFATLANTAPTIVDDRAILGGFDGRVFAHELQSGYRAWTYRVPGQLKARPVVEGYELALGGTQGHYGMLNVRGGNLRWMNQAFEGVVTRAVLTDERVFFASEDQSLYAAARNNGNVAWRYFATAPLTEDPAMIDQRLYLPVPGQALVTLDPESGEELWRLGRNLRPVQKVGENLLLTGDGRLTLVRPSDGTVLSEAETQRLHSVESGPDESIFTATADGRVLRLNVAQ